MLSSLLIAEKFRNLIIEISGRIEDTACAVAQKIPWRLSIIIGKSFRAESSKRMDLKLSHDVVQKANNILSKFYQQHLTVDFCHSTRE